MLNVGSTIIKYQWFSTLVESLLDSVIVRQFMTIWMFNSVIILHSNKYSFIYKIVLAGTYPVLIRFLEPVWEM